MTDWIQRNTFIDDPTDTKKARRGVPFSEMLSLFKVQNK